MFWASGVEPVEDRQKWNRHLFETLTSNRLSRNKYFTEFDNEWFKAVHRRFLIVHSIKREAKRLGTVPETHCWVSNTGDGLFFHMRSPRLHYERVVALQSYEWEWLHLQEEIRFLLEPPPEQTLPGPRPEVF